MSDNYDTTDFPAKPCRQCGKTDRPQFHGTCNDGHCDSQEKPKPLIELQCSSCSWNGYGHLDDACYWCGDCEGLRPANNN